MESCKKNLKIAGILLFIVGAIISTIADSFGYCAISCAIGAYILWLSSQNAETLKKHKIPLTIIATIAIIFNCIASVFLFISIDKISSLRDGSNLKNAPPTVKKKVVIDPEVKKIDMLLKLGVGMIIVSGILFATTSWNFISDVGKLFFLLLLSSLFAGLSLFTEKKLKLYNTSFMYWVLSMVFLQLIIVAILFFKLVGPFICYVGEGYKLAIAITAFTIAGLSLATYLKYGKSDILNFAYYSIYISTTFVLAHFFDSTTTCFLLGVLFLGISILAKKDSILFNANKMASYILLAGAIICNREEHEILFLLFACITTINHFYLANYVNNLDDKIPCLWISHILLPIAIVNCSFLGDYSYLLIFLLASFYIILIKEKIIESSKNYQNQNYIVFLALGLICISATGINETLGLLLTLLFAIVNYFLELGDSFEYTFYLEPITVLLFIISLFSQPFLEMDETFIITMTSIIYCVIHFLAEGKRENIYWYSSIIAIVISILMNTIDKEGWLSILILIPSIYLFFSTKYSELTKNNKPRICYSFIVILIAIYNFLYIVNFLNLSAIIASVLFIWLLGMIIILTNEYYLKTTCYFTIVVPLLKLTNEIESETWRMILYSILILYITFLSVKYLAKNNESKNALGLTGIVIAILFVFINPEYIVGIYIGLIGIITTMIGYYKNEFKTFFKGGIIITVVNIIYQLRNLWEQIPFWLYLLVGGLALIGFVTYKEMNNKK